MRCDRCGREAILFQRYSGLRLCGEHFQANLVARSKQAIRAHGWIRTGDRIAVALSGGAGSSSLLHLLSTHFGMRPDLSLVAITVDEGAPFSRDMSRIGGIAKGMGVEWAVTSFAEEFENMPGGILESGTGEAPPSLSGPLRDHALASLAGRVGATKLALDTSLDDEARSVFRHVISGEAGRLVGSPEPGEGVIPRIRPFLRIPEVELSLYARLNMPGSTGGGRRDVRDPMEREAGEFLEEFTYRHPSAPFSIARLGEALALAVRKGPECRERDRGRQRREPCVPARPARGMDDRVTGHG
jgi:hypothetical protein